MLNTIEKELKAIYRELINTNFLAEQLGEHVHPDHFGSAINLHRYLVLRSFDLRSIHDLLSELGLSGLRTSESYVYRNIVDTLRIVRMLKGKPWEPQSGVYALGYRGGKKLLKRNTNLIFGKKQGSPKTRIMVTLPTEANENKELVQGLIGQGMDVARINMSHDDPNVWENMIENVHTHAAIAGKRCLIYMDISGPKIRTGEITPWSEIKPKKKKKKKKHKITKIREYIPLQKGDHLILSSKSITGKPGVYGKNGELLEPAQISVTLPNIVSDSEIGDRIFFDDGAIESIVCAKRSLEIEVIIQNAPIKKHKLKSAKGINLPDTHLALPALTHYDKEHLPFALKHADLIGYSFVRTPADIRELYQEIRKYRDDFPAIILKIENKEAFQNLPLLLFEAMKAPKVGVMIARGDLAVELGAERIAEVQDQIMWICEAAHVPVIWATQVLENLAKTGIPSRAEITDASSAVKAECVMLNKGPYIHQATKVLSNILIRMEKHTSKKKSKMRALNMAKAALPRFHEYLKSKES